jgi:hypothetical protein
VVALEREVEQRDEVLAALVAVEIRPDLSGLRQRVRVLHHQTPMSIDAKIATRRISEIPIDPVLTCSSMFAIPTDAKTSKISQRND